MRIRTRVKIGGTLTVCVLLAYGAMVLHLDRTMGNLAQEVREANEIVNKITILRSLTQDFLLYRTERAQRQWAAVYDEVLRLLRHPEYRVLKSEYGIGDAPQKLKIVGDTFSRLMAIQPSAVAGNPEGGASGELQNRLTTQLLLASQDLLTRFIKLTETINGKLIATQRLISSLDILALLVLGILMISNVVFLQRSVVKPVLKLHEGAEIIGAGNLDHKVGLATPDEIGELSQAFDRMTANLQQVTVSRDDLAAEIEERQRAEEALRQSEEHYRYLFDNMLNGYAYCQMLFEDNRPLDFIYVNVNRAFEVLTGLKDVKGKKVSEVIPGLRESDPQLFETYGRVSLTGIPEQFETHVEALNMWFSISVYSPQKEHFVAIFDVITQRKRAEEEVQRLASFPQMNPAPVIEIDLSGAIIFYNQAALEAVAALGPEADLGALIPEDLGDITAAVREKQQKVFFREVRVKDKVFSQNIYFAEPFKVLRIYSMDITKRQEAEEALRESREDLNQAQAVAHTGSWRMNVQKNELTWSDENHRIFGIPPGTPLTYETFLGAVHPEDREHVDREWLAALKGEPYDIEHRIFVDGAVKWVRERAELEFDSEGRLLGGFGTTQDITGRKLAEEKLQRTLENLERSNLELEQFAYISSHDLQEPLRKIANFADMLAHQYQGRLDERAERYFGYITDGAKRMQTLINDLLSYSRVGRAEMPLTPASLEEILQGTISDLQALIRESGAAISHDPLPILQVNPHQMGRLLQNLIINGIKFHDHQSPRIHLAARQEGQEWVISVRDNGIGFDRQYAEGIFKVFKRLHAKEQYPGTGIGLAICKKIVERHGGRIWAESEPGRGSTFYFTIPA